ncbi:MAG: alpha/beta hydrolase [Ardenticatenaceae bacterium]|nr:alpha/beta hydrolase [Ardenticatenaceae bacterium]MCB9444796.1 alpha/beta hydrolase [Ardenticatenaceae bacterium]
MAKIPKIKVAGIPEGFRELSFTIGDVTLNYVVGPENGPPLLLIPGQMESWQGYKLVLPELSQRFHIYVPDLRGHGQSTWTPGRYSYNICGNDLQHFIQDVIRQPALVAGLSSGGVLAIWLAANAPEDVLAVIAEDPPIFSSIWPRIQNEKLMANNFKLAVEILGKPGKRDVAGFLSAGGIPVEGKSELLKIPSFIIKFMFFMNRIHRMVCPGSPYDTPFLSYNMRAGHKFLSEYDTDFSRATFDGDLSRDFSPEDALKRVKCPMLLMRAKAYRHESWGIVGAIDDDDLERIKVMVDDLQTVEIGDRHEIHMIHPQRYIDEIIGFVARLRDENKLL